MQKYFEFKKDKKFLQFENWVGSTMITITKEN